jgi:simple sugar transport system ATP-binding protein
MEGIVKYFGSIQALKGVNFYVHEGEHIGLVGDNGAGKSTLIRILSGMYKQDKGKLYIDGKEQKDFSAHKARELGILTVHQGFGLVDCMNAARNIFLGEEPIKKIFLFNFLDLDKMKKITENILEEIGIASQITPGSLVATMSGGERQALKIGRAIFRKARLIILDEPTIGLSIRESDKVREMVKRLKESGIATIYISHNIDEVYDVSDRLVVLDAGTVVGEFKKGEVSVGEIKNLIRGKKFEG